MRLPSFIAQLSTRWIPLAVALSTVVYEVYLGNLGMGLFGATVALVVGL